MVRAPQAPHVEVTTTTVVFFVGFWFFSFSFYVVSDDEKDEMNFTIKAELHKAH